MLYIRRGIFRSPTILNWITISGNHNSQTIRTEICRLTNHLCGNLSEVEVPGELNFETVKKEAYRQIIGLFSLHVA